jgi:hypothetical protein
MHDAILIDEKALMTLKNCGNRKTYILSGHKICISSSKETASQECGQFITMCITYLVAFFDSRWI